MRKEGVYDIDGKCVNCGHLHPCECESEPECDHRNEFGSLTFEKEDERCSTDRGTFGSIVCICTQCGQDIGELVDSEKEAAKEDADSLWRSEQRMS